MGGYIAFQGMRQMLTLKIPPKIKIYETNSIYTCHYIELSWLNMSQQFRN